MSGCFRLVSKQYGSVSVYALGERCPKVTPLLLPLKRHAPQQRGELEALGLPTLEDGLRDVRRKEGEAQHARDEGAGDLLVGGELRGRAELPALDLLPPAVRAHEGIDEDGIEGGSRRGDLEAIGYDDELAAAVAAQRHRDADREAGEFDLQFDTVIKLSVNSIAAVGQFVLRR